MIDYTPEELVRMQTNQDVEEEPKEGWPEGENYAQYAPPSDFFVLLVDFYISKLETASLTVDEQQTAATFIGEHVRKLRNTLATLMK